MQIIPFKQPGAWEAQIELTGVIFILNFYWNALNEYWVMNIYNRNDDPIALGIKVVVNWDLTSQIVQVGMPAGEIVCQNILGLTQLSQEGATSVFEIPQSSMFKIQRFDMGESVELFYYEPGEIEAL